MNIHPVRPYLRVSSANQCGIAAVIVFAVGMIAQVGAFILIGFILLIIAGILEGEPPATTEAPLEPTNEPPLEPAPITHVPLEPTADLPSDSPQEIAAREEDAERWAEERLEDLRAKLNGGSR